jgi:hypothetical protein
MSGPPTREDLTYNGLRALTKWLESCSELGWKDEQLPQLEALWLKWHDRNGLAKEKRT